MATASVRILRQLFWWQKIGCDLVSCNKSYATSSISWCHCVFYCFFVISIIFLIYYHFPLCKSNMHLYFSRYDFLYNNVFIIMKYFNRSLTFLWMNAVNLIDILTPIKVYNSSASFNNNYSNVLMLLYRILDEKNSSLRWKWNSF